MFCSQMLFPSAAVAFRTNFLSLVLFNSDLSRTNLKLSSSATWPYVVDYLLESPGGFAAHGFESSGFSAPSLK